MELEIKRNLFHMVAGIVFLILIYFDFVDSMILFVFFSLALFLSFLSLYVKIPVLHWFLERFDRDSDINTFPGKGSVLFILGMVIASLFAKDIALAGIAILTFGDSVNIIVGLRGSIKNPFNNKRFIEGFFAGLIAAIIVARIFVSFFEAFIASVVAMIFEGVDMKYRLNDNIMIPLISCLSIYLLRLLLLVL